MDDSGPEALYQWFLPRLIEAWDAGSVGSGHVDDHKYVQWAGYGLGLQIECASNRFLEGPARLTQTQVQELRRRGWHDPLGDDLPNHWQVFLDREDVPKAAAALVEVVTFLRGAAPQPHSTSRPVRSVVLVPVGKVSADHVLNASVGALSALSEAVVVDHLGVDMERALTLPVVSTPTVVEVGQHLTYPLLVESGLSFGDEPISHLMRAAGDLLGQMDSLRAAGHDVLVIGPRLLPPAQWVYAAALEAGADAVVLCLDETEHCSLEVELLHDVLPPLGPVPLVAVSAFPIAAPVRRLLGDAPTLVVRDQSRRSLDELEEVVRAVCEGRSPSRRHADDHAPVQRLPRNREGKHEEGVDMLAGAGVGGPHYVSAGITCVSKRDFAELLRGWLAHPERQAVIGEPTTFGGKPLVRVRINDQGFHLNGDTRDTGVREYLRLVEEHGADLAWHVMANTGGRINKVALGLPPAPIKYFYLYADEASPTPYDV